MEKMMAQEAAEWGKTLDFPTVWAALMRTGEKVDQTGAYLTEMGRRADKTSADIAEIMKRFDKMGERFDRMMEDNDVFELTVGDLVEILIVNTPCKFGTKKEYRSHGTGVYQHNRKDDHRTGRAGTVEQRVAQMAAGLYGEPLRERNEAV